jgi:redox-sensitive bicupin YhaK (pirin superfamily)
MLQVRPSHERGNVAMGWLQSKHTFSFGHYFDPKHMGFHQLRVINEDRVQAGTGFDPHPHRDMEIISYVIAGALEHRDSMGNTDVIQAGDVQRMSAGTGVVHSEYNPSAKVDNHFLQIWILPEKKNLPPSYEQQHFGDPLLNQWRLLVSPDAAEASLKIHQQARLYDAQLNADAPLSFSTTAGRAYWLQLIRGEAQVQEQPLHAGDGLAIEQEPEIRLTTPSNAQVLLFELTIS